MIIDMFIRYASVLFFAVCFLVFFGCVGFYLLDYLIRKEIGG
jgi:hypothetical protein